MPTLQAGSFRFTGRAIVLDKDGVLVDFDRYWGALVQARVAAIRQSFDLSEGQATDLLAQLGYPDKPDPAGPLVSATRAESEWLSAGYLHALGHSWTVAREG
ncbi:MAG: hypothetical protein KGR26_14225, partial [Cyanobacteria bacterium REEB65]|nr:hypothetical protein [Cyanobacteria bacterium REEB65]